MLLDGADEAGRDRIEAALEPPNKINTATGLPFGWNEDDELDGFEALLA